MSPLLLLLLSLYSFLTLSITITHAYHPNTISTPTFPIPRILDIHHINLTTTSRHTYMSTVKPIMSEGCRISLITWKQGNYENQKLMSAFTGQSFDDLGIFDGCQLLDIAHHCTADFTIQNYTDPQANIISVTMGLCIPKNCTQEDLLLDLPTFMGLPLGLEYYGLVAEGFIKPNITYTACADQQTRWYQNRDAVAMVVVVCILAVITLVATVADHMLSMRDFALEQDRARDSQDYPSVAAYVSLPNFAQDLHQRHNGTNGSGHTSHDETVSINRTHEPIPTWRQFIHCFSAIRNIRKLIAPIPASASGIDMSCLNGIRVLSMIWVIVGHTVVFQLSLFRDPVYLFGVVVKRISFQVVLEAFYAVDSFFFLSGFLSAYFLFQQIQRGGRLTKLLSGYYLHRYLRLTPIYAFWLFMNWKLALFIGAGESPLQHLRQGAVTLTSDGYQYFGPDQACDKYWWTNLLYINNFHPKSLDDECMAWGWYLANDMQFAIILPILILIYHRHRIAGLALLIAMLTASCTYVGIVSHQNNFTTVFYDPNNGDHWNEKVYVKPWARIQPYLIGILYAYLLHARPQRIPTRIYWPCMAVAAFLMTSLVFGPAQLYRSDDGINAWSRTTHDLYLATGRGIWAIGLGYLCYSMIVGTGEEPLLDVSAPTKKTHQPGSYLTSILGHSIWTPLARLSYEAYLVHEIWVSIFMYNYRSKPYYSDLMYIYWIVGNVMMAFVLAFVGYVLVEKPIMNLTNWCMSTLRGKSSTKSQDD